MAPVEGQSDARMIRPGVFAEKIERFASIDRAERPDEDFQLQRIVALHEIAQERSQHRRIRLFRRQRDLGIEIPANDHDTLAGVRQHTRKRLEIGFRVDQKGRAIAFPDDLAVPAFAGYGPGRLPGILHRHPFRLFLFTKRLR